MQLLPLLHTNGNYGWERLEYNARVADGRFLTPKNNEMKTKLSIEQSARLIELGVDEKMDTRSLITNERRFTLTDILSILPKEIKTSETIMGDDFISELQINWDCNRKLWRCAYSVLPHPVDVGIAPELIDALNSLLIWAIENNHVNLNTEKK